MDSRGRLGERERPRRLSGPPVRPTAKAMLLVFALACATALLVALLVPEGTSKRRAPAAVANSRGATGAFAAAGATGPSRAGSTPTRQQSRSSPRRPRNANSNLVAHNANRKATVQGATPVSLARMVGQLLMVRMSGISPDPGLMARIRSGELGGVILYEENIASPSQTRALTTQLQQTAREGGNPPLLIATDQEGGQVKRLPWAPPELTPAQMGAQGAAVSESEGERTGAALRAVGINVDLAPVLDVAHSAAAFIWREGRSFGMSAATVSASAGAFAAGVQRAGVAATGKHFPGVGGAITDTDLALERIASEPEDRVPYVPLIASGVPLIMVSTAVYENLDPSSPAALSRPIITGLLRGSMGYQGAVITDDLERPTGHDTADAAIRAVSAGADIILISTTEQAGANVYPALLSAAQQGVISRAVIEAADARVRQLKEGYAP